MSFEMYHILKQKISQNMGVCTMSYNKKNWHKMFYYVFHFNYDGQNTLHTLEFFKTVRVSNRCTQTFLPCRNKSLFHRYMNSLMGFILSHICLYQLLNPSGKEWYREQHPPSIIQTLESEPPPVSLINPLPADEIWMELQTNCVMPLAVTLIW